MTQWFFDEYDADSRSMKRREVTDRSLLATLDGAWEQRGARSVLLDGVLYQRLTTDWPMPDEVAVEIALLLKVGLTYDQIRDLLRLMRVAIEAGHPNIRLPYMPKVTRTPRKS